MIKIGILGAGAMGRHVVDLVCQQTNEIEITGIYDPDPAAVDAARHTFKSLPTPADSVDAVLDSNCDWVMIASLNNQHAEQTIAAFNANKHVFCQKPLATNFEDCIKMRDAWRATDREFVIGFTLRYSPHYRKIKQLIDEGVIGDVISLEFNETLHFNHGGFIHGDWRRNTAVAGSHVLEKCCHDIDIVNWLLESRAKQVASFGGTNFFLAENAFHIDRLGKSRSGQEAYSRVQGNIQNNIQKNIQKNIQNNIQNNIQDKNRRKGENPFLSDKDILDNQVVILEYESGVRASFHMNANTAIPERRLYICGSEGTLRADVLTDTIQVQRIGYGEEVKAFSSGSPGMHGGGDPILAAELVTVMQGNKDSQPVCAGIDAGIAAATTCFAIDEATASESVKSLEDYWSVVDQ